MLTSIPASSKFVGKLISLIRPIETLHFNAKMAVFLKTLKITKQARKRILQMFLGVGLGRGWRLRTSKLNHQTQITLSETMKSLVSDELFLP